MPVASGIGNGKITSSRKSSLFFIVIYLSLLSSFDLPELAPDSVKHNFRNYWKSLSVAIEFL